MQLSPRDECANCPFTNCPKCPSGQECIQKQQLSCTVCPKYVCEDVKIPNPKKFPIGGVVGGVIGIILLLGIIGGLIYYYLVIYKKKKRLMLNDDNLDLIEDDMISQEFAESLKYENGTDQLQQGPSLNSGIRGSTTTLRDGLSGVNSLEAPRKQAPRRVSTYESFTKPTKTKTRQQQLEARQRRLRQQQIVQQANSLLQQQQQQQKGDVYLDQMSSNRNSIATTISSTNASNILPIAYIPGVTVRPTKNNTKSIYSYETDSIFSDLNTIENASIIGDVVHASQNIPDQANGQQQQQTQANPTMTAIKAQPRLVNVDRIEEKDEDVTDEEDDQDSVQDDDTSNFNFGNKFVIVEDEDEKNNQTRSDSDGDSDVDSDIVEINRATSIKAEARPVIMRPATGNEILIDLATDNAAAPGIPLRYLNDDGKDAESGSFVFDVQFEGATSSPPRSPFEDPRLEGGISPPRSPFEDPK